VLGVGGYQKGAWLHGQQVIFPHHAGYAFVVEVDSLAAKLRGDPAITVAAAVLQNRLLDGGTYLHLFFSGGRLLEGAIKARPANLRQVTHALDTQATLHRHHRPDLLVDAVSPEFVLRWRRASIFCKAPLKKSTSNIRSAKACLSSRISCCGPPFFAAGRPTRSRHAGSKPSRHL